MGKLSDGPASSVPQSAATFFSPNKQQQQQLNGSGGELSSKTTASKNLKNFPVGASAAALLCDYLEKFLVWMFADSEDPGAGPHTAGKPAGDPHYFLTGYFGPVASETEPASGLTVSGSIPVSLLHKWGLSRSQFPFCFSRLIICFLLDRSIFLQLCTCQRKLGWMRNWCFSNFALEHLITLEVKKQAEVWEMRYWQTWASCVNFCFQRNAWMGSLCKWYQIQDSVQFPDTIGN